MDKKIWYNTILNALVYKYTIYKALIIRDDIQSNQLIAIHSDLLMVTRIKKLRCLISHYFLIISIMIDQLIFTVNIYQKLRGMGVILSFENPNHDLSLKIDVEVCR